MKSIKYFFALLSVILLTTGCIEDPEYKGASNFKIDEINKDKVSFNVDISTYNPNGYKLKVRKSKFKVYLNDEFIGNARLSKKYKMKKKTTTLENVPVEILLEKGVFLSLMKIVTKGTVKLRLEGVLKASVVGIPVRKKIDQTRSINLKDLNINLGQFLNF
ncbi:MAG TPA: LEA type 2 family protein [Brumimicrobium sp.]|nr:LEA type 2 family protein [Brumimicrobium sp.]